METVVGFKKHLKKSPIYPWMMWAILLMSWSISTRYRIWTKRKNSSK